MVHRAKKETGADTRGELIKLGEKEETRRGGCSLGQREGRKEGERGRGRNVDMLKFDVLSERCVPPHSCERGTRWDLSRRHPSMIQETGRRVSLVQAAAYNTHKHTHTHVTIRFIISR